MTGSDGVYGDEMEALTDAELEAALDASADTGYASHPMQAFLAASARALASVDIPTPTPELSEFMSGSATLAPEVAVGSVAGQVISLGAKRDQRLSLKPASRSLYLLAGAAVLVGVVALAQLTGMVDLFSNEPSSVEVATQPDGTPEGATEGFEVGAEDAGSVRLLVADGRLQVGDIAFGRGWTPEDHSTGNRVEVIFRRESGDVATLEAELQSGLVVVTVTDPDGGDRSTSYFTIEGEPASVPDDAIVEGQTEADGFDPPAGEASTADPPAEAQSQEPSTALEASQPERTELTIVEGQSPSGLETEEGEPGDVVGESASEDDDDSGESDDAIDGGSGTGGFGDDPAGDLDGESVDDSPSGSEEPDEDREEDDETQSEDGDSEHDAEDEPEGDESGEHSEEEDEIESEDGESEDGESGEDADDDQPEGEESPEDDAESSDGD